MLLSDKKAHPLHGKIIKVLSMVNHSSALPHRTSLMAVLEVLVVESCEISTFFFCVVAVAVDFHEGLRQIS